MRAAQLFATGWLATAAAAGPRDVARVSETAVLVQAVLQGDDPMRAVTRIHYLGQEDVAATLLETHVLSPHVETRRRVAQALADLGSRRSGEALLRLVADEDPSVRMYAAQGLGRVGFKRAIPLLQERLTDPSAGVRGSAGRALGRLHAGSAGPALMRAAQAEGEPEVRAVLLESVGDSGDRRAIPALTRMLTHSSESAREGAARALCLLGAPAGLEIAKKRLAAESRLDRRGGLALLEGVRLAWVKPLLVQVVNGTDVVIAASAARLLYMAGDRAMLPWLVKASHKASADDRRAIELELEKLDVTDAQRSAILKEAGWK